MTEENILTLPEGVNPLLRRAVLFLESGDFASAGDYCGKVLDAEPENPIAYLVKLMGDNNIQNEKQLVFLSGLPENKDFKFARRFASPELAAKLDAILAENERNLALAPLRAACAARQQQLRQFLDGGVFSGQAVEVQNRIAAEQKFMLAPSEDAAAKEIAATNALIDGIRKSPELRAACAARQRQLRQLLEGGVSPEEANEVQNRIEAEQKLMLVPSEDGAAKETAATNALIDRIGKIRKLRAACATRQQQLRQLLDLDGGLPPEEATEVQNRIEAEQKFMLAPSEDAAEKEIAETNALIDRIGKIRKLRAACAARQQQLRQLLDGGLLPEQATEVQNRIEAEQKLMLVPSEDGAAKETAAMNALIDRIKKAETQEIYKIFMELLVIGIIIFLLVYAFKCALN